MRHVLRKYTSNRGSALFMVLSTMTALLISVMAMYFTMVSSRQSQYAVFNKMQATQSAQSIVDIVYNGLTNANRLVETDEAGKELLKQMEAMNTPGETITTSMANFQALDPNNPDATRAEDSQIGAYAVTITLKEVLADGTKMYDISVITSVDGNRDVVHMEWGFSNKEEPPSGNGGRSELFAATGYIPNDAYLDGGYFLTNVFFDTEFTYINQYGSKAGALSGDLATGGTLLFQYYLAPITEVDRFKPLSKPTTWAIRGDLEQNGNNIQLAGGSKIMINGDAIFNKSTVESTNGGTVDVYILGDFIYNNTASTDFKNCNVYVAGDFYMADGKWIAFKSLYVNGKVNFSDGGKPTVGGTQLNSPSQVKKWDENAPGMSVAEVEAELADRTETKQYAKWEVSDSQVNDAEGKTIKIRLNASNAPADGVPAYKCVFTIAYDDTCESAKGSGVNGWKADYVGKGFTIDGFEGDATAGKPGTIILDTGDKPENVLVLRLKPYIDMDNNGTAETFAWTGKEGVGSSDALSILVKGRGSVVMEVAEGATYQECDRQQTMHYSWFRLLGGIEGADAGYNNMYYYDSGPINSGTKFDGKDPDVIVPGFMHIECKKGDGCSYTESKSTTKCDVCGKELTTLTCPNHGDVISFCTNTECKSNLAEQKEYAAWKAGAAGTKGFCQNRIDKPAIKAYLNSHLDLKKALKYRASDPDDNFVYPNTNIYLVTCSESTDIRFSTKLDGSAVMQNSFYGFLYAPYITFVAKGSSGLNTPRFVGGLIVSDYVIDDNYAYLACYPDKMPEEVANLGGGSMTGLLSGKTTKTWKTIIGGYN